MSDDSAMVADEISDSRLARLRDLYSIGDDDIVRIQSYGDIVVPQLDEFLRLFYDWLEKQPDFDVFFPDETTLAHVQAMSRGYWDEFFRHDLDDAYIR